LASRKSRWRREADQPRHLAAPDLKVTASEGEQAGELLGQPTNLADDGTDIDNPFP